MIALLHAHSGLRYLVLLAGAAALLYFVVGLVGGRPAGKGVRIIGAVFVGLLDLQILLGLALVISGRFYPQLWGHLLAMLLAAASAHVALAINRRKPTPGFVLPLAGITGALVLIALGILAIGRGLFTMTVAG